MLTYNPITGALDVVSTNTTVISGIATHSDLQNLSYATSGHTGFTSTTDLNTHKTSSDHDDRYYTESEISTISGNIVAQIPSNFDSKYYTETELDAGQLDNRYYTETEVNTISGALNTKLDTHKSSTDHDSRYYTESEVNTISGALDTKLTTHRSSTDHDDRYYTESEITTISGNIVAQIPATYTNEMAQDAVGTIMSGIGSVTVSYNDVANTITISGSASGGGLSSIVEDTTPELGGNLDFHGYTISGTGHMVTGSHSTVSGSYEVVNVIYATVTGTVSAYDVPIGTLYIVYT